MVKTTFFITESDEGQRLDKYLKKVMPSAPPSFLYRLIREKDIRVNNLKTTENYILSEGDEIIVFLKETQADEFLKPYTFFKVKPTFSVIYEDENVLVVNKPAGLLVHGAEHDNKITLTNMVLTYLEDKGQFDPNARGYIPSPVSRIDRDTNGIIIFSKKQSIHQKLATAFTVKTMVKRVYRLVVYGIVNKDVGEINFSLIKTKGFVTESLHGREAITTYKVLKRGQDKTYLEAEILTGRQHQIRVHFNAIGHPLVGDPKYGIGDSKTYPLALNAYSLTFYGLEAPVNYLNGRELIADNTKELIKIVGE